MSRYVEERIIFAERFQARTLDFCGQLAFARYDECEFVKCTILLDSETENLAFTDLLPNLPSFISRVRSGFGPCWGGLQIRPA